MTDQISPEVFKPTAESAQSQLSYEDFKNGIRAIIEDTVPTNDEKLVRVLRAHGGSFVLARTTLLNLY